MAFVKNNEIRVGDICKTTRRLENSKGYFEPGTSVKVIDMSYRGYDIEDKDGNRIIECGFDCLEKVMADISPCVKKGCDLSTRQSCCGCAEMLAYEKRKKQ